MAGIIVTTPVALSENAALEAEAAIKAGGGFYFRRLKDASRRSKGTGRIVDNESPVLVGQRVYYVDRGFITGFAIVDKVEQRFTDFVCEVTSAVFGPGIYAVMRADSWQWVRPIPFKGFQGYRFAPAPIEGTVYINGCEVEVIGKWTDPKPDPTAPVRTAQNGETHAAIK